MPYANKLFQTRMFQKKMSIHKDALTSGNKKESKCKIYKEKS